MIARSVLRQGKCIDVFTDGKNRSRHTPCAVRGCRLLLFFWRLSASGGRHNGVCLLRTPCIALSPLIPWFETHSRSFEDNRFVYAVISRRSGGVSIGVNLNPEKYCNFDCVYCQVDRTVRGGPGAAKDRFAAVGRRTGGNGGTGRQRPAVRSGQRFATTPAEYRGLNDIALSGDGEPTASPALRRSGPTVCRHPPPPRVAHVLKLVLITNATLFQREAGPQGALKTWTPTTARSGQARRRHGGVLPDDRPLQGQAGRGPGEPRRRGPPAAHRDPIVVHAAPRRAPPRAEQEAYCDRLCEIVAGGGQIKLVQIHTIACFAGRRALPPRCKMPKSTPWRSWSENGRALR